MIVAFCADSYEKNVSIRLIFLELIENRCKKYQPDWEMSD